MSDQEKPKGQGLVRPYLGFIDTSVLFKKPISCFFALIGLLIPVYFLIQIIQYRILESGYVKLIAASILILAVLVFAGLFGFFIWWHRRITRDEGPKWYPNFRRFIQTLGEWTGTLFAIIVFGCVLILLLLLRDEYRMIIGMLPVPFYDLNFTVALYGPIVGFLIIIATKIFLFLLDPVIWLVKQIWKLFVRIVLYFYRCIIKVHGVVEQNTPVWFGVIWLISVAVVAVGLVLCHALLRRPVPFLFLGGVFTVALGLGFMAFLVIKRKNYGE